MYRQFPRLLLMLLFVSSAIADPTYKRTSYVVTITHPVVVAYQGSMDEFLTLSATWAERVLKRNPKILDVTYLLEYGEADTLDLLVLYEYESRKEAAEANTLMESLIHEGWAENERGPFFDRLGAFVVQEGKVTNRYQRIETLEASPDQ